jgi:hypothetical protein
MGGYARDASPECSKLPVNRRVMRMFCLNTAMVGLLGAARGPQRGLSMWEGGSPISLGRKHRFIGQPHPWEGQHR